MAIRRSVLLSLAAAAVAVGGAASSAVAQQRPMTPQGPASAPAGASHDVTDGLILSANDFALAPGETLVDGGPGVTIAPEAHAGAPLDAPGHGHGHQPMFAPGSEMAIGMPCPSCEPGHYASAEALYFQLDENRRVFDNNGFLRSEEFDEEWAGRLTFGRRFDCVNGYEFVYAGPLEWDFARSATFAPAAGVTRTVGQSFQAKMNSLEFNRTYFGWDVAKATHGIRAILYEENAAFARDTTPDPAAGEPNDGTLSEAVDNFLIGPQAGLELYYPLSNRWYAGAKTKGALFANFVETDLRLNNIEASDDELDIAGMFELGTSLGFRVTDAVTATLGYELWYLMGVGTSYSQIRDTLEFRDADASDEVLMHGLTAGIHMHF